MASTFSAVLRRNFAATWLLLGGACSMAPAPPDVPASAATPTVDQADPVPGVPARGYEPAVVLLDVAGQVVCAGALVASDVVVTARHCVSILRAPLACPDDAAQATAWLPPGSIAVRTGDDVASTIERAHARAVVAPAAADLCASDVALLLLDEAIDDVQPLGVRATGAASGDRVRTVGWVARAKVLRDHVTVLETSPFALRLREIPADAAGGPALDESTGDIVGIASRASAGGPSSGAVYTRTDAFLSLIELALAQSASGVTSRGTHLLKSHKGPADMGSNCVRGEDCAAGACVEVDVARYCSRTCSARDRCPPRFRCQVVRGGEHVCIRT